MSRLQAVAKQGHLPMKVATCRIPLCQACFYGKLTRQPWRGKSKNKEGKTKNILYPGQCVSLDQLESPVIGFVGQMIGILTKKRYKVATIFVDHFSNFSFVHLQSSTNAHKKLANSFLVVIRHYHANN
jgi:hypothetical protein